MRNELRFLSNALVYVVDKSNKEAEASLRDLSEHGLSIKCENYINVEPNSSYVVAVIPEEEAKIGKFQLEIESKWVKLNKLQMESGFSVVVSFGEKEFKDYLEYLDQKGKTAPPPPDCSTQPSASGRTSVAGRPSPVATSAEVDITPADNENSEDKGN